MLHGVQAVAVYDVVPDPQAETVAVAVAPGGGWHLSGVLGTDLSAADLAQALVARGLVAVTSRLVGGDRPGLQPDLARRRGDSDHAHDTDEDAGQEGAGEEDAGEEDAGEEGAGEEDAGEEDPGEEDRRGRRPRRRRPRRRRRRAKKTPAKKTPAKKTPAKKTPAKKTTGQEDEHEDGRTPWSLRAPTSSTRATTRR